jgi:hypothetical protein
MKFRILDGMKMVEVEPEAWNAWHADLNEKQGDCTRIVDTHQLSMKGSRVKLETIFTGGPGDAAWLTFVTGYPGLAEYTATMADAKACHHALLHTMLDMGWKINPDYSPKRVMER